MAEITLHVLKPSVNNLTARVFVRAANLDFEEVDAWGKTGTPEFLEMNPAHLSTCVTSTASSASIRPTPPHGRWWIARCFT